MAADNELANILGKLSQIDNNQRVTNRETGTAGPAPTTGAGSMDQQAMRNILAGFHSVNPERHVVEAQQGPAPGAQVKGHEAASPATGDPYQEHPFSHRLVGADKSDYEPKMKPCQQCGADNVVYDEQCFQCKAPMSEADTNESFKDFWKGTDQENDAERKTQDLYTQRNIDQTTAKLLKKGFDEDLARAMAMRMGHDKVSFIQALNGLFAGVLGQ
jgi:hypothetical protein